MARANGLDPLDAQQGAGGVFRSDLYRQHMRDTGAELPGASEKLEGSIRHQTAVPSQQGRLILEPDLFFDGTVFDPSHRK